MKLKNIFLLFSCLIIFAGCQEASKDDPTGVLRQFIYAVSQNDLSKARTLASESSQKTFTLLQMSGQKNLPGFLQSIDTSKLEYGPATINGSSATVAVKDQKSGEATEFNMVNENGLWKVSLGVFDVMGMGMKKMKEKGLEIGDTIMGKLPDLNKINIDSLKNVLKRKKITIPDSIRIILERKKNP